jgi:hypothetical protein
MNQNDFVTIEHLLSEITTAVDDMGYKKGLSQGRYKSWIQDAIQELAFDTFIFKRVYDFEMPKNFQHDMPKDIFNIREIYAYDGTLCNPTKSQVIHYKRLFNNMSSGDGYTARIKDDGSNANDMFLPNQSRYRTTTGNYQGKKYYWNQHNGVLMLSKECADFKFVRIIANTMGGEIGEIPAIPRFFERAVVDYVIVRFYFAMRSRDPRMYSPLYRSSKDELDDPVNGSWNKARKRVKSMDSAEKESWEEYTSSMYHR